MFFRLSQKLIIIKTLWVLSKQIMLELDFKKALKCWNKSKLAMSDQPILITLTDFIKN